MKYIEEVNGSAACAQPFIIDKDTIYIHTNIKQVEGEENLYTYHEYQFTYDNFNADFLTLLDEKNKKKMYALLKEKKII